MTLHHTAVVLGDNSNAPARLRQHQRYHQNDRGWIDIAYHVSVDRNGNIYEARGTGTWPGTPPPNTTRRALPGPLRGRLTRRRSPEAQLHGAALAFAGDAELPHRPEHPPADTAISPRPPVRGRTCTPGWPTGRSGGVDQPRRRAHGPQAVLRPAADAKGGADRGGPVGRPGENSLIGGRCHHGLHGNEVVVMQHFTVLNWSHAFMHEINACMPKTVQKFVISMTMSTLGWSDAPGGGRNQPELLRREAAKLAA